MQAAKIILQAAFFFFEGKERLIGAAEWSCIINLSSVSLQHNSVPVAVPDFTRGDWNKLDGVKFYMKE